MCRKLFLLVVLVSSLLLSGMIQAASIDVTAPGDTVKGIPDDGDWPGGEAPLYVIDDNINTKFLHFKGDNETSGFQVTASLAGKIVTGMSFTTGGDAPERDPIVFELYGSNVSIDGPYTLIASGDIVDFNQETPWPRKTKNETPISFDNDVAYDHYQVLFPVLRVPENGCCMQIAEVELLVTLAPTWWVYQDIGTTGGHAWQSDGTYTVRANGHDIWGGADGFGYVYRPVSGDCNMTIDLISMDLTSGWAKVGIMLRETLDPDSKHATMTMTGSNGVQFVYRQFTGGGSADWTTAGEVPPEKLRIRRVGNDVYGAYWAPIVPGLPQFGFTWYEGSVVIPELNTDVYIGLAVCATNTGVLCTAVFEDVDWPDAPYYRAWKPSPVSGTVRMPADPITLSWNAGDEADSHDVYFGTTDPPPFIQNQTETTFDTGPLDMGTGYYWRINEVGLGGTAIGDVWTFRTARVSVETGGILGEIWFDVGGVAVPDLTGHPSYPYYPSMSQVLPLLEAPVDIADNFGARFMGYLLPEQSGNYTFWIASDDASQLWLSTDDKAWNASQIAYVSGWTCSRCWDMEGANQQSDPVYLEGDQLYYISAIYKEGGGGDNCSVAWQGPDSPSRDVIDGYFLSPSYPFAFDTRPLSGTTWATKELKELRWRPGTYAASHDVYFGTSNPPPFIGNQTETSLPLGTLAADTDYFWKVDEVDGSDVWVGNVESFAAAEWVHLDIGITLPGISEYDEPTDTWTITGGGYDIWDNDDKFHFAYTMPELTRGDCTITAKVASIEGGTSDWRKAGVMIRESRNANSKQATMAAVPQCMSLQYRSQTGGGSADQTNWDQTAPGYIKLVRDGDRFTGFRSYDGEDWIQVGSAVIEMPADVLVGMAVTAHDTTQLTTAVFEEVSITTPDPRQSWDPSPENGAEGVPVDPTLSWGAGEGAMYHIVYFSENYDDVVSGAAYKAMLTEPSYNPGILDLTKTYYWCVDEMWGDGRNIQVTLGDIWSFTISDHRLVDDFEAYSLDLVVVPQDEVEPADIIVAETLPAQTMVDPGHTIPGYTIEAVAPDAGCLIADWAFEGNYDDTSGSGFHGTPAGDATIVVDATRGNVLSLDGDLDYVDCGNPAALNFGTGNWSLSVWAKNTMTGTGDANKGALIANGGDGGGGHRYCLIQSEQDEAEVTLVTDDDSTKAQARGDTTKVNDDVWHHVLGVRDGDTIRIYIDGVEEGSAGLPADYDLSGASQANVLIGAMTLASDLSIYKDYAGLIDDAQIYNCALTEGNARYLAGVGDKVVDPVVIPPTYGPLLVHYEFEDNANDSSGNSRDGTEMAGEGDMPTYEAGMLGQAIRFTDNGDHVLDDDAALYMNGLDALTVSCWIKSEKTDIDEGWIHFSTDWNDQRSFRYDKDGASSSTLQHVIKYGVATTGGSEEDESSDYVQTTNWQHVAMTWQSGTGMKLYIDGVRDDKLGWDAAAVSGVLQGYTVLHVGKGSKDNSNDESWNGLVDDVQIYSVALSYGQIRTLAGQLADLPIPPLYGPMIAEYMFDADASDTSGNIGHDGVLLGDAKVEDGVLKLDGDGDCVDLGRDDRFNMGQGPFSFSVWVNMSAWGGGWGSNIVGKRGENGRGWVLRRCGDSVHLTWTTRGPGDNDPEGTIELTTGVWHHIVGVYDGSSKAVYIDGALDRYTGGVNNITMSGHNVYIGARANRDNNGQENFFNGMIDEVRFYNYALTCLERLTLSGIVATNPLSDTWTDSSAEVSSTLIGNECDSPHSGDRAIRLDINGSGEVSRPAPFEDWTWGESKAWVMYFKGDPDNVVDDMYVALTSKLPSGKTATFSYDGDMSDLKIADWQEWNIELSTLIIGNDGEEFPLPHVGKVILGLSGSGTVYFDDFWLMAPRCVPMYGPLADLTGDCRVDGKDLKVMADDWMKYDEFGSGLVARYEFEGNYDDISGNDRHATPVGDISFEDDRGGQVLSLPGGSNQYVALPEVGLSGNDPTTIACWAKADHTSIPDWTLIFGFTTPGGDCGSHFNIGSIGGPGGVGAHLWCWEATIFSDEEALEWRHYAMTFDGSTINYYGDGVKKGSTSMDLWRRGDIVQIGSRATQDSSFPGNVDDARVYKRALSDDEIVDVMGGGDPLVYMPLVSAANLSDDEPQASKIINFKDFNVLADEWLLEILWP